MEAKCNSARLCSANNKQEKRGMASCLLLLAAPCSLQPATCSQQAYRPTVLPLTDVEVNLIGRGAVVWPAKALLWLALPHLACLSLQQLFFHHAIMIYRSRRPLVTTCHLSRCLHCVLYHQLDSSIRFLERSPRRDRRGLD